MERAKALELESFSFGFRLVRSVPCPCSLSSPQPRLSAGGKAGPSWGGWFSPAMSDAFGFHNVCMEGLHLRGRGREAGLAGIGGSRLPHPHSVAIQMLQGEGGGETAVRGAGKRSPGQWRT